MTRAAIALVSCVGVVLAVAPAEAAPQRQRAAFALIIGSNQSVDRQLPDLRYADDDAARYFDLFRALGLRTYLLNRPDANTRRLHAQAAAEAYPPRRAALARVVRLLTEEIARARHAGHQTVFYFVFAGHGNVQQGRGYLTLEDHRLTARRLREEILSPLRADYNHLIVDACHSYFLAHSRGPGGRRRPVHGFSTLGQALGRSNVGLLLSTSAARESHEWEAFESGVFSHEVRSGLYGAADADGDGLVSYREIASFVQRANAAIPSERFRPRVYARPPEHETTLLDLRRAQRRAALEIAPSHHGRYLLETTSGVRLLDLHSGSGLALRLVRPLPAGRLYLRRLPGGLEYNIPAGPGLIQVAKLQATAPRTARRGAAHHAFSKLFARPYDQTVVAAYRPPPTPTLTAQADGPDIAPRPRWRTITGWSTLGLSAAALGTGIYLTISAVQLRDGAAADLPHRDAVALNESIDRRNTAAVILYGVAGAAALASVVTLYFWPESRTGATLTALPGGAAFAFSGGF